MVIVLALEEVFEIIFELARREGVFECWKVFAERIFLFLSITKVLGFLQSAYVVVF